VHATQYVCLSNASHYLLPYNCLKKSTWPITNCRFEWCYVYIGNSFLKCHY